jgi:oligopeptide/dipeptide ABC transporter ATP-binding protein
LSTLLSVRDLCTSFPTDAGVLRAADSVSFDVPKAGTVALVGESGSGKTITALSILRLVPPPGRIDSGDVVFDGQSLSKLPERAMRSLRGRKISMIFQEPMTSLNPVYTVGQQIAEVVKVHRKASRAEARDKTIEMLKLVGIASPETRVDAYPHQLSGGMRQRVMIAMALACEPELLIADEPTTALDVTIQAQILDLLRRLQEKLKMSVILITHDLGVVAEVAQQMVVMYAGRVVETGPVRELFRSPKHPYTEGLLKTLPPPGISRARGSAARPDRLPTIEGVPPDLLHLPSGCRFGARCRYAEPRCNSEEPSLSPAGAERGTRCFFPDRVGTSS